MYDFKGKVALITGGTEGIGLATAKRFVDEGAKVLIAARKAERAEAALAHIGGPVGAAVFFAADMAVPEDIEAMVAHCLSTFGRLDFAVNNAAASFPLVNTADMPMEAAEHSIAVDLRGTWLCMKHEIPAMQKTGGGAIVNVSSVNGMAASPKAAIYSATKHGVNGLTAAAAREYMAEGIRINTVCPGAIETPRRQRRLEGKTADEVKAHYADLAQRVPAGRVGTAEEVAASIVWLCSAEASYVVGHHLVVDGGLNA